MGRAIVLLGALILAACQQTTWQRFDGQSVHASAALQQQFAVDLETCRAFAVNAGNQIRTPPAPPNIRVTNNVTTNVAVQTAPQPAYMNVQLPAPPDIATVSAAGPSMSDGMSNLGEGIGVAVQRWRN